MFPLNLFFFCDTLEYLYPPLDTGISFGLNESRDLYTIWFCVIPGEGHEHCFTIHLNGADSDKEEASHTLGGEHISFNFLPLSFWNFTEYTDNRLQNPYLKSISTTSNCIREKILLWYFQQFFSTQKFTFRKNGAFDEKAQFHIRVLRTPKHKN